MISVVMSTYNGSKYIVEQLDSIRMQSRKPDEVLIFDDCSNDGTIDIISSYIEKYELEYWKLIVNEKNKGWGKNFIEGAWQSTGDIVFTCDQDDIWLTDKLFKMEKIMNENLQIEVLVSDYIKFHDSCVINDNSQYNGIIEKITLNDNFLDVRFPGCVHCIRRSLIEDSKKYWQEGFPHDAMFWRMSIFKETLYYYSEPLIYWRRHSNSTYTKESRGVKSLDGKLRRIEYIERFLGVLVEFLNEEYIVGKDKKLKLVEDKKNWIVKRKEFYNTHSIFKGIGLLKYYRHFRGLKRYLADWYIIFIAK